MSIFKNILEKLGIKKPEAPPAASVPAKPLAPVAPKPAPVVSTPPVKPAAPPSGRPPVGYTPPVSKPPVKPAAAPPARPGAPKPAAAGSRPPVRPMNHPVSDALDDLANAGQPTPPAAHLAAQAPAETASIPMIDVVSNLENLAAKAAEKLDWKVSIVDLLKLLGLDSSLKARKELAAELECPADLMGDSAKMNMWLHKTVLQKIAENGGNIPKELLD